MHVYMGLFLCTLVLGLRTQPSVCIHKSLLRNPSLVFYFFLILFSYLIYSYLSFFFFFYVYVYLIPLFHMFYCYLPLIC